MTARSSNAARMRSFCSGPASTRRPGRSSNARKLLRKRLRPMNFPRRQRSNRRSTPIMAESKITPHFYDQAHVDRLTRMIMALAAEVAVLRERLDTHEHVAGQKKLFSAEDVERYEPSDAVASAREAWRNSFIDRLLKIMSEELEPAR